MSSTSLPIVVTGAMYLAQFHRVLEALVDEETDPVAVVGRQVHRLSEMERVMEKLNTPLSPQEIAQALELHARCEEVARQRRDALAASIQSLGASNRALNAYQRDADAAVDMSLDRTRTEGS